VRWEKRRRALKRRRFLKISGKGKSAPMSALGKEKKGFEKEEIFEDIRKG